MDKQIPFRIVGLQVQDFAITDRTYKEGLSVEVLTSYEFGVSHKQHLVNSKLTYAYLQ